MMTLPELTQEFFDETDAIYQEFARGPLSFAGAILRLVKIGYEERDAHDMVCEWADALESEQHPPEGDDDDD